MYMYVHNFKALFKRECKSTRSLALTCGNLRQLALVLFKQNASCLNLGRHLSMIKVFTIQHKLLQVIES
jgi:hypothetical protein